MGERGDWEDCVDFWATAVLVPLFTYWAPTQFGISKALTWVSTRPLPEIAGLLQTAISLDEKVSKAKGVSRFDERLRRRLLHRFRRVW